MRTAWGIFSFLGNRMVVPQLAEHNTTEELAQRVASIEQTLSAQHVGLRGYPKRRAGNRRESSSLADLLLLLPRLKVNGLGHADFHESDALDLNILAIKSEKSHQVLSKGMAAIGNAMASLGPDIEDGSVGSDTVEALGAFMAEISEVIGMLVALDVNCQRALMATGVQTFRDSASG